MQSSKTWKSCKFAHFYIHKQCKSCKLVDFHSFLFFSEPFPRIFVLLVLMVLTVLFICVLGVRMDCRVVFTFSNLCHVGIIYFLSPAFLRHWDYREQSRATRLTNGVRSPLACGVWMLGKFGPVYVRGKKSSWERVFLDVNVCTRNHKQ